MSVSRTEKGLSGRTVGKPPGQESPDWGTAIHQERSSCSPVRRRPQCRRGGVLRLPPPCCGCNLERSSRPPAPSCSICCPQRCTKARSCSSGPGPGMFRCESGGWCPDTVLRTVWQSRLIHRYCNCPQECTRSSGSSDAVRSRYTRPGNPECYKKG